MKTEQKRKLLEEEILKLKKPLTGMWIGSFLLTIFILPIGVIMLFVCYFRHRKVKKLERELRYL